MKSNSKVIGDLAELKTAALFAEHGYFVLKPLTDNAPYDLVVDKDNKLYKVQVKARKIRNGIIAVELRTTMLNYVRHYQDGDFDLLAVYNIDDGSIAIVPWDDCKDLKTLTLRIDEAGNGQKDKVKYFKDYIGL